MGQGSQSESILVEIRGVPEERFHKVATANVVDQIAEELVAERVVAHVLQHASAVGVGMGLLQVLFGGVRETLQQQRLNLIIPHQIHDLLVGQHRIARRKKTSRS